MTKARLNVHKKVLHKVCEKFDGAEEFINPKIEEICRPGKIMGGRGDIFCL